ncbi:MAG: 50S ribosomal protein L24 [Candidatus Firestonebacteria bacterium GWA2_43_8]|nr:ribosomal protein L24 [uncultured bacterium]OGF52178.1 MAG: 50S ribosomal protein L24 [Candidatus Firestonebacteria bacterium GWA2_43_8]
MSVLKTRLKKGDTVELISGEDKGKKGRILQITRITNKRGDEITKVLVEGVNFVKKHVKPNQQAPQGGIVSKEGPLSISKVMLVCPRCSKPTKVGIKILKDGKKARACKHKECGELIEG